MIVTKFNGGLGNQMFQYAAGRALSLKHKASLKFDTTSNRLDDNSSNVLRDFELNCFNIIGKSDF